MNFLLMICRFKLVPCSAQQYAISAASNPPVTAVIPAIVLFDLGREMNLACRSNSGESATPPVGNPLTYLCEKCAVPGERDDYLSDNSRPETHDFILNALNGRPLGLSTITPTQPLPLRGTAAAATLAAVAATAPEFELNSIREAALAQTGPLVSVVKRRTARRRFRPSGLARIDRPAGSGRVR